MLNVLPIRVSCSRLPIWPRLAAILIAIFLMLLLYGTTTYAATNAVTWPPINLTTVESGFSSPINLISANDGTDRLFVLERSGTIYIIENGERLATPFLDITNRISSLVGCDECGLLGLAFPPNFADEGYFFVNYTNGSDLVPGDTGDINGVRDTVIARFSLTGNPNIADPGSHFQILAINQPEGNHNGGHILFGPGDYLYIAMGDGGGGGDTYDNAQDPASLLGKILRISVSGTATYTIPADNPFVDEAGYRDEIWAMGVRNPWRFNFDRTTGDLYVADVGQQTYEEVNHVAAAEIGDGGMNFGWPIMEGNVCFPPNGAQDCVRTGLTEPVTTYDHTLGCSVTGGYVYHSPAPAQAPIYLYGDYCSGRLRGLQPDGGDWVSTELDDYGFQITSFGEDENGNIYLVSYAGTIYQIDNGITGLSAQNDGPKKVNTVVHLTATVTSGVVASYTWSFGDGNNGNGATPTHTYTEAGIYTATVVASNAISVTTATTTVYVGDVIVDVSNSKYTPANATIPAGGTVVWVLNEGQHSVTADDDSFEQPLGTDWPPFAQSFISATFADAAVVDYHCSLHGGDGGVGMSGTLNVLDGPLPIAGLSATNDGPKQTNAPVGFTATITDGTSISYTWDFGDGNVGSGITPSHPYTVSGIYTATVVASNATNAMTATTTVYVGDAVVDVTSDDYQPEDVTIQPGEKVVWVLREGNHSVTADDESFEQPAGMDWSPFVQSFDTPDTYDYHCTIHGNVGGIGMAGSVIVDGPAPPPITGLTASNNGPTEVDDPTGFTAAVTGGTGISYAWDFGDNNGGSGITPSHTYTQSGLYTATVVATNATNSMTATTTVYVGDAVVDVTSNQYTPRNVTIPSGGKVVWVLGGGTHSVTADDDSFEQPAGSNWSPFIQTFVETAATDATDATTIAYHCTLHGGEGGIGMAGSVTVGGAEDEGDLLLPNIRLND